MKISTITRTILTVLAIINMIRTSMGKATFEIEESQLTMAIEYIVEVAIIALGFWKNNSFTVKAQKADKYLEKLRALQDTEEE